MNPPDSFERRVSDWLHQDADYRVSPHLDAVLRRTSSERQRPAWSSLERWLPVQSSAQFARLPRYAWLLIVVGLMLTLGATALAVGSRIVTPQASPFGADSRGNLIYGTADGDIHVLDTATNQSRPLITGTSVDSSPLASPNGAFFVFERREPDSSSTTLMIADADGSDVQAVEGSPRDIVGMEWSPEGDRLAISGSLGGGKGLWVLGLDGERTLVQPEEPGQDIALIREPHWLPNGQDLTFLGGPLDTVAPVGLYLVGADGEGLRALVEPVVSGAAQPAISPDGTKVAYTTGAEGSTRVHVIDIDTGADAVIAADPAAADQRPAWSPDGRRVAFERYHGETYRIAVAPVDGGPVVEHGPTQPYRSGGSHIAFTPDGTRIVAFYDADDSTWVLDPDDSSAVRLSDDIATPLSWQRTPD